MTRTTGVEEKKMFILNGTVKKGSHTISYLAKCPMERITNSPVRLADRQVHQASLHGCDFAYLMKLRTRSPQTFTRELDG